MNWNQLQYVVTIAEEKNITKAARKLFISQPSLSLSIQSLERELNITLFERSHGTITLTYAGTLFYEWALSSLHSKNQLDIKLNDISNEKRNLIRLGISPHRSLVMLPSVLECFYQAFPNCEIQLIEKPTYILKNYIETNQIDFMIDVPHPDTINYQSDLLTREKIILAVPSCWSSQFPFFYGGKQDPEMDVSLSDLDSYPFIMLSADHILGNMSRKMCESASFYPNIRISCENIETAMSLVNRQLGISFVPEIFKKQPDKYPCVHYFSIKQFHHTRDICLVYPRNRYKHTQLSKLLQLFKEMVPSLYA